MKREDDQKLWELLGKARTPALSPFFARNVVRQVREAEQESGWRETFAAWLRPRRLIPASAVALALVTAAVSLSYRPAGEEYSADDPPDLVASIDPQDYDVVAELDDLLAAEDDSLWNEPSSL